VLGSYAGAIAATIKPESGLHYVSIPVCNHSTGGTSLHVRCAQRLSQQALSAEPAVDRGCRVTIGRTRVL